MKKILGAAAIVAASVTISAAPAFAACQPGLCDTSSSAQPGTGDTSSSAQPGLGDTSSSDDWNWYAW